MPVRLLWFLGHNIVSCKGRKEDDKLEAEEKAVAAETGDEAVEGDGAQTSTEMNGNDEAAGVDGAQVVIEEYGNPSQFTQAACNVTETARAEARFVEKAFGTRESEGQRREGRTKTTMKVNEGSTAQNKKKVNEGSTAKTRRRCLFWRSKYSQLHQMLERRSLQKGRVFGCTNQFVGW